MRTFAERTATCQKGLATLSHERIGEFRPHIEPAGHLAAQFGVVFGSHGLADEIPTIFRVIIFDAAVTVVHVDGVVSGRYVDLRRRSRVARPGGGEDREDIFRKG